MQAASGATCLARKLGHRVLRERRERNTYRQPARKLADHAPHGVLWPELVVAMRCDEEAGSVLEPAAEEGDRVERCLVRPVQVLEHCDGRRATQFHQERREDRDAVRVCEGVEQRSARLTGDIVHRPERTRSEERFARTGDDTCIAARLLRERSNECRLSDPGLTEDEGDTAAASKCGVEGFVERCQGLLAFKHRAGEGVHWCTSCPLWTMRLKPG